MILDPGCWILEEAKDKNRSWILEESISMVFSDYTLNIDRKGIEDIRFKIEDSKFTFARIIFYSDGVEEELKFPIFNWQSSIQGGVSWETRARRTRIRARSRR